MFKVYVINIFSVYASSNKILPVLSLTRIYILRNGLALT